VLPWAHGPLLTGSPVAAVLGCCRVAHLSEFGKPILFGENGAVLASVPRPEFG